MAPAPTATTVTAPAPTTTTTTTPGSPPPRSGGFQHVVWVWMENRGYNEVLSSGQAPYINSLASTYGLATNYYATDHPSLPNYIEATSGGGQGVTNDSNPPSNVTGAASIFGQLPNGQSRSLNEGMPSNCFTGDAGNYVVHHNPMAYYSNLGAGCNNFDVPFGSTPDISAKFTFVTPNLIDDMHDGTIAQGDAFLKSYIPALQATAQYEAGNTVIFVVWDEDGSQVGGANENNHVICLVISPYTHSVRDATSYTHYSLLRTTEELLGLPLLGNAAAANSMRGRFGL